LQLDIGSTAISASFINPRSSTDYGFSELRIENLIDPVTAQRSIQPRWQTKPKEMS
jgi:hypothetical protein